MEDKKREERRKGERRKPLTEKEVKKVLEEGKLFEGDKRSYKERRKNNDDKKEE